MTAPELVRLGTRRNQLEPLRRKEAAVWALRRRINPLSIFAEWLREEDSVNDGEIPWETWPDPAHDDRAGSEDDLARRLHSSSPSSGGDG